MRATEQTAITRAEARSIAKDAYVYGFPLVENYRIQYAYFVDRGGIDYKGTWNRVHHHPRVYTPQDTAIQQPSSDMALSHLGADLRAEPLVLAVPIIERDRYYAVQFVDAYTFNFAYIGSRTTGNRGGTYMLAGPSWVGDKPSGVDSVIRCETELAFVLYRTQLVRPDDVDAVNAVQAGYKAQPLSAFLGRPAPPSPKLELVKPLTRDKAGSSLEFFKVLNFALRFCPPHAFESQALARFARLGIGAGLRFEPQALSPMVRAAIQEGIADAWQAYSAVEKRMITGSLSSADVYGTREYLRNNYLYRMVGAVDGIYVQSREESIYGSYIVDVDGQRLDGASHRYILRFSDGRLPPVNAFWSLTLYMMPSRILCANPLDRYLINSAMLPQLARDADGGITIHVAHESPGSDRASNWLPAPHGPFMLTLRLYWPKPEAFNGQWKPPMLQKAM